MPDRRPARVPVLCRILIGAAAWIAPRKMRDEWRRKWRDGAGHWWAFLHEREEFQVGDGYRQLVRHCATAFADAAELRFRRERIREFVRGPAFVLLAALVVLAATAIGSGGFRMLRSIWTPLPYPDADRLVTVAGPGVVGPFGVPAVHVRYWAERARTLKGIGGYREVRFRRGIATDNLFELVGVKPVLGRVFRPGDRAVVLVSYEHWRDAYRGDPGLVGRRVMLDGEPQRVIGVLPPDERLPGLPDLPLWTLADVYDLRASRLFGAIARLAPGATPEQATRELMRLAGKVKPRMVYEVRVAPLRTPVQGRTLLWIAFPAFGLVVGVVLVAVEKQSPVAGHVPWRRRLRCWAFLVLKTTLVLGALTLFWIEAVTARTIRAPESDLHEFMNLMAALVPTFGFLAVCALATLWCVADQRRRCPVCLQRLAMPVTLGSWSSSFLDPVTTEFVCERGHGSLALPETDASSAERDRWTEMDESWRDLFTST